MAVSRDVRGGANPASSSPCSTISTTSCRE